MTEYEDLLRQEAERRGWTIEVHQNRISVGEVPYRKKDGEAGRCQVSVETEDDGLSMKAPDNGRGAIHAARLSGVEKGCAYQATGEPVGNVLWSDNARECVISIKRDDGEYVDGWHALAVYTVRVAGEVGVEEREHIERIFKFPIAGGDARDIQLWRDRARGQQIGIVGLGGVGLWILDLMSKTDVREIKIWDGDEIEGRNLVRAPGWASQAGISDLLAPDGTFIHPRAAERTKFCSAHNRPAPEAVTSAHADVEPTGAAAFRAFLRHRSTLVPFLRQPSLHSAARQPAGTGSAQILRNISPKSRRFR